ncbi:hypothetical protein P5705_13065 [Pseudomonas entomophila]|uniref:hypothetical protein n=1 Tax=Pseudomonas entomophila TaxID=312306 RepID=UPI002405968D|nr:hypothetical protein [Pseudomonas entomophila]MDF9618575.1 hypothetical protein [Pseudomonas entomophila]
MDIKETGKYWVGTVSSISEREKSMQNGHEDIRVVNFALLPLVALGLFAVIVIGWRFSAVGSMLLWASACLVSGATIGFLFGIPRSGVLYEQKDPKGRSNGVATLTQDHQNTGEKGRPNTNLEEISDWLTKILVGLSLVNLAEIKAHLVMLSRMVAASLSAAPTNVDVSAGTALVIGFTVLGFLCGYLYTRLFLQGAFIRSDKQLNGYDKIVASELSKGDSGMKPLAGEPAVPSSTDRQSAERILQVAPINRPDEVLAPLRALASEYENLRRMMPSGEARTYKMSEIVNGMRKLALATDPYLSRLAESTSPGERLAAIIILQMKFHPDYIEWLADRLVIEPAFSAFQAVSALLARIKVVGYPERQRIKAAIIEAKKKMDEHGDKPKEEQEKLMQQIIDFE